METTGEIAAERDGQLEGLAAVTKVGLALLRQLSSLRQRPYLAAHVVTPLVAHREPERREDTCHFRDEHRLDPQLIGELTGVKRPGAAKGDGRGLAWIAPALDRDDAKRAEHLGVHDLDHVRGLHLAECTLSSDTVELEAVGQPGRKPSEQEVGVCDRGPLAAAAVASWSWIGPGALRPDVERSAGVDPGDGAAARPDRVDVEARQPDREAGDRPLDRPLSRSARDQADVRRRPAHVERQRVGEAGARRDPYGPDDSAGRPGEQ